MAGRKIQGTDERPLPMHPARNDEELAAAVRRALLDDMAVPDTTIHSSATDGTILLEGTVTCASERREAERAAASVPGVLGVRNELAVWPSDVESELVRETTREALEARRGARTVSRTVGEANVEEPR